MKRQRVWGKGGRAYSVCRHEMQMMPLPFSWPVGQRNVTGESYKLSIPSCSVTGPLLILLLNLVHVIPHSTQRRRGILWLLWRKWWSQALLAPSHSQRPLLLTEEASLSNTTGTVVNHGGMGTFTPCVTLDSTCPEMTTLFKRVDCSCFSCGSPWSGCSSSSQQVNQRHQQAAMLFYKAERSC